MGWTTNESGFHSHQGHKILSLGLTQPPIQWVIRALSRGDKAAAHEADHSPSSVYEVNAWSYTYTSSYADVLQCLIKHRNKNTCTCVLSRSLHTDVLLAG